MSPGLSTYSSSLLLEFGALLKQHLTGVETEAEELSHRLSHSPLAPGWDEPQELHLPSPAVKPLGPFPWADPRSASSQMLRNAPYPALLHQQPNLASPDPRLCPPDGLEAYLGPALWLTASSTASIPPQSRCGSLAPRPFPVDLAPAVSATHCCQGTEQGDCASASPHTTTYHGSTSRPGLPRSRRVTLPQELLSRVLWEAQQSLPACL